MEVEAIDLQGKDAEIIISLRDDETSQKDQIHETNRAAAITAVFITIRL